MIRSWPAGRRCCPMAARQPSRPSRLAGRSVVAAQQRTSAPRQHREPVAPQLLAVLETAALALAVGGHAVALVAAHRQQQAALAHQQQQRSGTSGTYVAHPVPASQHAAAGHLVVPAAGGAWGALGSVWLTLPLVVALALGRLRTWLAQGGEGSTQRGSGRVVGEQAVARLLRLEASAGQQADQLKALGRHLDKLSVRSRLVGRDLKLPIKQLEAAAGQHAEALVSVAGRMERLEKDIRDTEELVEAMQGVSAKQFQLLMRVMQQQQQAAAQQAQASPPRQAAAQGAASAPNPSPAASATSTSTRPAPPAGGASQSSSRSNGTSPSSSNGAKPSSSNGAMPGASGRSPSGSAGSGSRAGAAPWPYGSGAGAPPAAGQAAEAAAGVGTDEWGRRVVPLPHAMAPGAPPPPAPLKAQASAAQPPVPSGAPATALSSDGGGGRLRPLSSDDDSTAGDTPAGMQGPAASAGGTAEREEQGAAAAPAERADSGVEGPTQPPEGAAKPGGAGLSTDTFLDILDQDPFFRAEREMIRTFVNQPKKVERPSVEILPPLYPPPPPPETPAERRRRQQVEEWRQRVARSWEMQASDLAAQAAGEAAGAGPEGGAEGAAPRSTSTKEGEGAGGQEQQPGGVRRDENDDGSTTYHFS